MWVQANDGIVRSAYKYFTAKGEWPLVQDLQRQFDRNGVADTDVQGVIDTKPQVLGEAPPRHAERFTLQIRHLTWLHSANSLVSACLLGVRKAYDAYLSDQERPVVRSDELGIGFLLTRSGQLLKHTYLVLRGENPSPFGSSSVARDGHWTMYVDSQFARRFRGIETPDDFVACQDAIRVDFANQLVSKGPIQPSQTVVQATAVSDSADGLTETAATPVPTSLGPMAERKPVLFLSWGKEASHRVASTLYSLLVARLPGVEVFFSSESILPGDNPQQRMFDGALLPASALLAVLTTESANSAYVIWETAAAWGRDQLVIPLFVNVAPADVPGPLALVVQGVHLADRHHLDGALRLLGARFGITDVSPLTEVEFEALLASARSD